MVLSQICRYGILVLLAWVILFLSLNPLQEFRFGSKSDEGYYQRYASAVNTRGLKVFPDLISWYASSDEARKHPAPIRVGYILLSAFLFKLYGHSSFRVLALISTLSFVLFLFISLRFIRKYFDLDTALLTVLLLASSPLLLGLSRRALIDDPVNLLWGLAAWLFLDVLLKPGRFSYVLFLLVLFIAITFKETSLILIPFFVMAGMVGKLKGCKIGALQIWGIIIYPLIAVFLFYGWIYGGLGALKSMAVAVAKTHLASDYPNPYAMDYCSGPWFRYLLDFLLLNPIVTLLFIGYAGYLCIQKSAFDFIRFYLMLYFIYIYVVLNSLAHTKVVRFVVNLEMVMALFAVLMLIDLSKGLDAFKRQAVLFMVVVGIFMFNWYSFVDLFYRTSLLDPISAHLLVLRHFIPG